MPNNDFIPPFPLQWRKALEGFLEPDLNFEIHLYFLSSELELPVQGQIREVSGMSFKQGERAENLGSLGVWRRQPVPNHFYKFGLFSRKA